MKQLEFFTVFKKVGQLLMLNKLIWTTDGQLQLHNIQMDNQAG
jgi:hypothetical protein